MTNIYNHLVREDFRNKFGSCLQQNTIYLCYENISDRERKKKHTADSLQYSENLGNLTLTCISPTPFWHAL